MGEHRQYKITDERFGQLVLKYRVKANFNQSELAAALGVSRRTIQHWEGGTAFPAADHLKQMISVFLHNHAFSQGNVGEQVLAFWEQADESAVRHRILFDNVWFDTLYTQWTLSELSNQKRIPTPRSEEAGAVRWRADWGEAPEAADVFGREHELAALAQWALADRCRVIALLGIGGIGKTTLATKFAISVARQFTLVFWRSLRNAPPLEEFIADCLTSLTAQPAPTLPSNIEHSITRLLEILRQQRCLLILDNVETLLESESLAGRYRPGYEGYRLFFQRIAETEHQSCLILTSREMLSELEPLEGTQAAVRALKLVGLAQEASQELLRDKDLFGTPQAWGVFVNHYSGNPLALKIASATIRALFGGDLAAYLRESPVALYTMDQLLTDQFERISALERDVMAWLAIERTDVTVEDLGRDLVNTMPRKELLAALMALQRRSMVERDDRSASFTLLPVVQEFESNWLVFQLAEEIIHNETRRLTKFPLMKSHGADYIRDSQVRLLVQPVLALLLSHFGDQGQLINHLQLMVRQLQAMPLSNQGYAGGNFVNLLICLQGNIRGWDFSNLALREVYLEGSEAQDANLAGANIIDVRFTEPLETISAMTISTDGQYMAIGSYSGKIQLWQIANGKESKRLWTAPGSRRAWALAFNSDATLLASGDYRGKVCVWDVANGRCLQVFEGHISWVHSVAFSPDGHTLVSAGDDATVRVWDIRSGINLKILKGHAGTIWTVAFSPDSSLLVSGGVDGIINVWDVHTGEIVRVIRHASETVTIKLAMNPANGLVASCGEEDGLIKLWDIHTGRCVSTIARHKTGEVSAAFNTNGTILASGSNAGAVELWEIGSEGNAHYLKMLHGHRNYVGTVVFGRQDLLATGSYAGVVKLWDVDSGRVLQTIQGHSRLMSALAFSPDGRYLAQGDGQGMVRVWDTNSGRCISAVQGHNGPVWSIKYSPNGEVFASCGEDVEVKLWEADGSVQLKSFTGHLGMIWALAFSPDGALLASGGTDREIRFWDTGLGNDTVVPNTLHGSPDLIWSLAFDTTGKMIASGHATGQVKLWDLASGLCLDTLQHDTSVVGLVHFCGDGQTLISSSNRVLLKRWDIETRKCLQTIPEEADANRFKAIGMNQDIILLATGSGDQILHLWRIETASDVREVMHLTGHPGQIWGVALSQDQRMLASSDDAGMIIIWDARTGAELLRMSPDRPYERMNIRGIKGLLSVQLASLKALGAVLF